jgi:hypothetical protein
MENLSNIVNVLFLGRVEARGSNRDPMRVLPRIIICPVDEGAECAAAYYV